LIRAIETDTRPKGSMYDGRAALEMILAIYESHRLGAPIELPLKNRRHPLSMLSDRGWSLHVTNCTIPDSDNVGLLLKRRTRQPNLRPPNQ